MSFYISAVQYSDGYLIYDPCYTLDTILLHLLSSLFFQLNFFHIFIPRLLNQFLYFYILLMFFRFVYFHIRHYCIKKIENGKYQSFMTRCFKIYFSICSTFCCVLIRQIASHVKMSYKKLVII